MKISLRFAATTEEEEVCLFCHSSGVWLVGWW
jgi:esterase/lipase superfamily enzyme